MLQIKRALISVFDKTNLLDLVKVLSENGVEIISSGGTASLISEHDYKVKLVEEITSFPEMMDGRVKTLHPVIHGGILYLRDKESHVKKAQEHSIDSIDLVVVNLYPFEKTVAKPAVQLPEAIEQIDIGGPSLLRSASKNHQSVVVLSSPEQYSGFIQKFQSNSLSQQDSLSYACEAFAQTSRYDSAIHAYFSKQLNSSSPNDSTTKSASSISIPKLNVTPLQELRYGENPHQKASLFKLEDGNSATQIINNIKQFSGKELSYNNWLDIEAAWTLINEFEPEIATCAIIKHNTPCGVAFGETITEAYEFALESDPISAFGGIVALNQEVNLDLAGKLAQMFLEVIIAPSYSQEAIGVLKEKKNLRLITAPLIMSGTEYKQYKSILGNGLLVQDFDNTLLNKTEMKVVTEKQPSQEDWLELLFAFRVCKHVRSNAIVAVNGNRTVGICGGQTNRVNSVRIAIEQASDLASNAVLASDGFFPFADNVELAAQARIRAIIQPGGSIRDNEVIAAANKYQIPMVFTALRHFKH
jgi:phosphoribosylaminoimidazolecarboxamide formyltransferase / IMP cyclohydrolase